jgi:hypothetical protein
MRLKKKQVKQIIREEKLRLIMEQMADVEMDAEGGEPPGTDHHWPRADWSNAVGELVDKWHDMESDAFDVGDPSMMGNDDMSQAEARDYWREQVDQASYDLENEITIEVRKVALAAMKAITDKLINGEYA